MLRGGDVVTYNTKKTPPTRVWREDGVWGCDVMSKRPTNSCLQRGWVRVQKVQKPTPATCIWHEDGVWGCDVMQKRPTDSLVIESPVWSGYSAPGPPNRLDFTPEP
jgi:hypothetical protein